MSAVNVMSSALFMGPPITAPVTITYAATVTTDASTSSHFRITLTGAMTLANPTGAVDGQIIRWELIQDATGGRVISYGTKFAFGTDLVSATLSVTASKRDFLIAQYNAVTDKFYVVGMLRGY